MNYKLIVILSLFTAILLIHPVQATSNDLNPEVSFGFLQKSQNIEENKFNDLNDVYFYLSILLEADSTQNIPNKDFFIAKVRSFQNADGGFGYWERDRSKAGSTIIALLTLDLLGSEPLNKTSLKNFLYELQVLNLTYGNYGFKSSFKDTDADLSNTYDVIYSLDYLGFEIPNKNGVIEYLKDHQNVDGGFGLQTNRKSGIIWTSTLTHTRRGLEALQILNEKPDFTVEALDFVKGRQSSQDGFSNKDGESPKVTATYNAILSLKLLNSRLDNINGVKQFIKNNQESSGGFIEYSLDNKEGIHTTYYAISSLNMLNEKYDKNEVTSFARSFIDNKVDGGFANYPGLESTLKSTFGAVLSLNLIGKEPLNKTEAISFINSFQNSDGGFGQNGRSNVESTYRAVLALNVLNGDIANVDKTVEYLQSVQNHDGGFGFEIGSVSRVSYTYRAVRAIYILGSSPSNKAGAINFLKSAQNSDGGFSNNIGDHESGLGSTYRAIRALDLLGSSANRPDKAKEYILKTRNGDGGFKKSPDAITSPENISKSIYTYNALLTLGILDVPIDDIEISKAYIKQLRNPDLAFSPVVDFTSEVSSTFTSLWSYYHLNDVNIKPELKFSKVEYSLNDAHPSYVFTTRFYDNNSQIPDYVHLILNDEKHVMSFEDDNLKGERYIVNLDLPLGEYSYYFEASDGLELARSKIKSLSVNEQGELPNINIESNYDEGTVDTVFNFNVQVTNIEQDKIKYVQIKFNDGIWHDMNKTNLDYFYQKSFNPGIYMYKVKVYDGVNLMTTKNKKLIVYEADISKPNWETFEKINLLLQSKYNQTIVYANINKEILNGNLYWKIDMGSDEIFIDYSGENFYEEKANSSMWIYPIMGGLLLVVLISFVIYKKKRI